MKKILFLFFVLSCAFFVGACTQDNEETVGNIKTSKQTRAEEEDEENEEEEDPYLFDEMGASPLVEFYSIDEEDNVTVSPGESATAQAPLALTLTAREGNPDDYKYICEWRIWSTKDNGSEANPLITRFEENTTCTLTKSGGYGIKLYVTFSQDGDTIEYESDPISVVISESKLTCPDGFSPNNDSINDTYRITAQSIVKLDAKFFNRWGEKLHSVTLETAQHVEGEPNKLILWDGKYNGKVVNDGVYFMYLDATGSDDVRYNYKKTINVLTGYTEHDGSSQEGGGSGE